MSVVAVSSYQPGPLIDGIRWGLVGGALAGLVIPKGRDDKRYQVVLLCALFGLSFGVLAGGIAEGGRLIFNGIANRDVDLYSGGRSVVSLAASPRCETAIGICMVVMGVIDLGAFVYFLTENK